MAISLLGPLQGLFLRVRVAVLGCVVANASFLLHAQAVPTASRAGDLQVGGIFSLGSSDYHSTPTLKGVGFYSTFDFKPHFGIDAEFHQVGVSHAKGGVYERTFEVGPRYVMHFGPFSPYAKLMVGRGVFNFPPVPGNPTGGPAANLAFNMFSGGLGVDYSIRPSINVRADYELQRWSGFPPNGLSPQVFSLGIAYRFH